MNDEIARLILREYDRENPGPSLRVGLDEIVAKYAEQSGIPVRELWHRLWDYIMAIQPKES